MSDDAHDKSWPLIFWGIMLVALGLRLYNLAGHSIWYDESVTIVGAGYVDWQLSFLSNQEARTVPLFALIGAIWIHTVEALSSDVMSRDFLLRLIAAIFSMAIIPAAYRMSMVLFNDKRAAIAAAAFVAISPFHIYYAQEFRPHSLYALLCLLASYNVYLALERGGRRYWIGIVAFGTLAFYAYYFAAIYLVCSNLFMALCLKRYRNKIVPWALSQIAIILLIVPAGLMALQQWTNFSAAEEHWFPMPNLKHVFLSLKVFVAGYSPDTIVYYALLLIMLVLLAAGIVVRRKESVPLLFILSMSIAPIVFQIIAWNTQDFGFFTYRIQLPFSVPVFILMGVGLAAIKPRIIAHATMAAFTLVTAPAIIDYYTQDLHPVWNHRIGARYKVDVREAANWVESQWRAGDYVAHTATQTYSPFMYRYFDNPAQSLAGFTDEELKGLLKDFPDERLWDFLGFFPRRVEDIVTEAERIWFVQSWWEPLAPEPIPYELRAWFDAHYTRVDQERFDGLDVYLYEIRGGSPNRAPVMTNGLDSLPTSATPNTELSGTELLDEHFKAISGKRPLVVGFDEEGRVFGRNLTDEVMPVTSLSYTTLQSLPAIAFDRPTDTDIWRVTTVFHGTHTMSARLGLDESATITKTISLPVGKSLVYLRANTSKTTVNLDRASVGVTVSQNEQTLATAEVVSHRPMSEGGWQWLEVGSVDSTGGEAKISITASNPNDLERCYFDLESMVFVEPDALPLFVDSKMQETDLTPGTWVQILDNAPAKIKGQLHIETMDNLGNIYQLYR